MYFFVAISSLTLGFYLRRVMLNVQSGKKLVFSDLFDRAMGWCFSSWEKAKPDNTVEDAWGYKFCGDDYERYTIDDPSQELPEYDLVIIKYWFGKKLYRVIYENPGTHVLFPIYESIKYPKTAGRGILSATIGKREDDKSNIDVTSYITECLGPKKNFYKDKGFKSPLLSSLRLHGKFLRIYDFFGNLHIFDQEQDERIEILTNIGNLENIFKPLQEEGVLITS